jgi:hypothetical protein
VESSVGKSLLDQRSGINSTSVPAQISPAKMAVVDCS